jgi:hypothetical protein
MTTTHPSISSPVVFQFSDTDGTPSAGPSSGAPTPVSSDGQTAAVAPANWVEKVHNVQARADVPDLKRRRVEPQDAQNGTKMPVRGSSGILGQYVKDKAQESSGASTPQSTFQSTTVDLTSGMHSIPGLPLVQLLR